LSRIQKFPLFASLNEPLFESVSDDLYTLAEEVEDDRYIPEDAVLNQELSRKIQEAIASLSADHRLVFILTEYHGMSYQEVADIAQCPVGTVASRKNAAIRKLRKILSQYR
jgi:RNA polymerase sigma-70 factor (ECF subfamily)